MKIIVDAMGGDNAPDAIVIGAINAVKHPEIEITLVGKGEDILRAFDRLGIKELPSGIEIVNASEIIEFDEDPTNAIRTKKDSSLTVGFSLLRDERGSALVSAGSTGALLSGATLIVKRVRGIRRAALAPVIPSTTGNFILIDCGANTECIPEYLLQFAYMGSFYAESILKITSPKVGLLNNGTEETKGTSLQRETYEFLKNSTLNFIGNIEAKDAMKGVCDVVVCDGYTGNIFLKAIEGAASLILSELKNAYTSNIITKFSALMIKKKISGIKNKLNPDAIGGTALLGISKPVIKAHGSSNEKAIYNAIMQAVREVDFGIAVRLSDNIERLKVSIDKTDEGF
ncbi:MAG: phosphate acyltransferase PlsX [Oscillospiraceae bacterium]|jgi:glycerol-3-phosphate acyltransferase PlsX|nr:phosphate acyltransferase PlsX [Oscillospiraceae bacterium]